ncbi:MAG: MaoC family dehydratase [Anaerolineaceae bacterium]|nr:MaoC family dehydratase [Anaerolineaceae bacterium]
MTGLPVGHPDMQVGQRATFSKTLTEADVSAYAGLVADFNPHHVDAEYARRSKFGQRTVHEMLTGGLISSVLSNKLPGPGSVYVNQQLEFLAPVFIGDTVTAVVEVTAWQPEKRLITLKTECINQEGRQVITGQAVLIVYSV